jgi:DNA-binding NtrC family response regulator
MRAFAPARRPFEKQGKFALREGLQWLAWSMQYNSSKMKTLRDKSVLIVDDDQRMLRALNKVLTGEGASVTTAQWAGDALDFLNLRNSKVDLVITDLRMPFVTGITVVFAIHQMLPALPIIVLTAFGSPAVKAECLRQGAAAFLEKPLDTAKLMAAIWDVLSDDSVSADPGMSRADEKAEVFVETIEARKGG